MRRKCKCKMSVVLAALILIATLGITGCGSAINTTVTVSTDAEADGSDSNSIDGASEETADEEAEEPAVQVEEAEEPDEIPSIDLADGVYLADFDTDSSMFHVNEAWDGKGILTVEDHVASIHIVLTSKNIVNLYPGLAEDAQNDEQNLLEPILEEVTYDDGYTEEVNAFDVPVPCIGEEFDLALIGTKAKWYDHKVSVSNPVLYDGDADEAEDSASAQDETSEDGVYSVQVMLEGGSGKAKVESPAQVVADADGKYIATIKWSSPHYDYMIVDGQKYLPVNTEGNSVFEIPIEALDVAIDVIADTVAMSTPHEIEYTLTFSQE